MIGRRRRGPRGDRVADRRRPHRARSLRPALTAGITWIALAAAALARADGPAPEPVLPTAADGLVGDWYVLVHYRDRDAEDPEQIQWDDQIWRLVARRGGLEWTLYPHVVLRDRTGRFERLPSGAEARTVGAWSPSPAQLDEIRAGLTLDEHEARSKRLRLAASGGWASDEAMRPASASAVAYAESWTIEGPPGRPVFVRRATLGSPRTDPARGRTVFTTREGSPGGDELRGDYERDGRLVGRFRMIRMRDAGGTP